MIRNKRGRSIRRYKEEDQKKAIGMLESLTKRMKNGELIVEVYGFWPGVGRSWTFKVVVKESEK